MRLIPTDTLMTFFRSREAAEALAAKCAAEDSDCEYGVHEVERGPGKWLVSVYDREDGLLLGYL
jgi:hypothetical protein